MEEISEAGVIHSQSRTISEIMERLKVCAEQRDAALDKLETLQKEHNALASSHAALQLTPLHPTAPRAETERLVAAQQRIAALEIQAQHDRQLTAALQASLRHTLAALDVTMEMRR
jgi:hypothetical protein